MLQKADEGSRQGREGQEIQIGVAVSARAALSLL